MSRTTYYTVGLPDRDHCVAMVAELVRLENERRTTDLPAGLLIRRTIERRVAALRREAGMGPMETKA